LNNLFKYSFTVEGDSNDNVVFNVSQNDKTILLSPAEAISKIFKHLKTISEAYIGTTVTKAVINVTSNLSPLGKEQIIQAAKLAGINQVQLIKNPVSVCLAYEFDLNSSLINDNNDLPIPEKKKLLSLTLGKA